VKEIKIPVSRYSSDLPVIEFYPNGGSNGGLCPRAGKFQAVSDPGEFPDRRGGDQRRVIVPYKVQLSRSGRVCGLFPALRVGFLGNLFSAEFFGEASKERPWQEAGRSGFHARRNGGAMAILGISLSW